jgi:TM2 domain-containing membrane protein YozV
MNDVELQIHAEFKPVSPNNFTFENYLYLLRCACDDVEYKQVERDVQYLNQKGNSIALRLSTYKTFCSGPITSTRSQPVEIYKFMMKLGEFYGVEVADYRYAIEQQKRWEESFYAKRDFGINQGAVGGAISSAPYLKAQEDAYKNLKRDFAQICDVHNALAESYGFSAADVEALTENSVTHIKSKAVAVILSVLFGWFGIDRFYLGYTGIGVFKLLMLVLIMFIVNNEMGLIASLIPIGFMFFWIIEVVQICMGNTQPKNGTYK